MPILRSQPRRNPDALQRVPPLHIPDLGHNLFKESIKIVY